MDVSRKPAALALVDLNKPATIAHGPSFIGLSFNILLLGVMLMQSYLYFSSAKRDRPWIRIFVGVLVILDILNTAFMFYFCYDSLITNFGVAEKVLSTNWSFATDPILIGVIAAICQCFFAWRVYLLTRRLWLTGLITITALVGCGAAIATGILTLHVHWLAELQKLKVYGCLWLVAAAVADTLITVSLVWYLRTNKRGFEASDKLIDKIIRSTVQTGLLTTTVAIVDLIVFLADPSGLHLLFNVPLAKLYSNSLLSSLNARSGWKYSTSYGTPSQQTEGVESRRQRATNTEIYVNVEQYREDTDAKDSARRSVNPFALASPQKLKSHTSPGDEISLKSLDVKSSQPTL